MRALLVSLVSLGMVVVAAPTSQAATEPGRAAAQSGRIVSEEPARTTPDVLDGTVRSLARVGDQIVVGGTFTQVRNPNTSAVIERRNLFAFDIATGRVSTAFDPAPDGRVYDVEAAPDGRSVYVAGAFTSTWGRASSNLVKADVASGEQDPTFAAPTLTGQVRDVTVAGGRLWAAGKFTHIGGRAQRALGTLNATTGRYDSYFTGVLAGTHRDIDQYKSDRTNVLQISTDPAGDSLVAVGNFTSVDGVSRHQVAKLDISGASYALSPWSTQLFTQACSRSFETYLTDVEYSPDGRFFVVSSTGAYGGSGSNTGTSGCDVVTRFEEGSTTGATPTWTAYPGGDTTWTVEVTDDVVYAGGHQRWQNNPGAGDRPGQGAVERPGIAALDSVNGLPYSWNPTRSLGVGVEDMLATEEGLYVGSDTDLIGPTPGNRFHARVALLPLSSGKALPARQRYALPSVIGTVAPGQSQLARRTFDGRTGTPASGVPGSANRPNWGSSVGAFMVNGVLYVGYSNGSLTKQTFDGSAYGPPTPVDAADRLVRQSTWHDTDVPAMTSLFYADGRIYFTRSNQNQLYSRAFAVESDVVGQQRFTVTGPAGLDFRTVRGAFVADGSFYHADSQGRLFRTGWGGTGTATGPLGSRAQVSGPGVDNQNWAARAMFVQQGVPAAVNQAPTAAFRATCAALTCEFDGSDSTDPEGEALSFGWDFGDDSARGTEPVTTHTYAAGGTHTVRLTVTDARGGQATSEQVVAPTAIASPVEFVAAAHTEGNRRAHAVRVPEAARVGDRLLLFFAANSTNPTYTGPDGWTELESREGTGIAGRVYTRIATPSDAGSNVAVTSSAYAKDSVSLAVYRGIDAGTPPTASLVQNSARQEHSTPNLEVPAGGGWLVSHWAEKSSTATAWQLPAGQSRRATSSTDASSGRVLSVLADSGGTVPAGPQGGLVATADAAGRGVTATVLLRAADGTAPANRAPTARAADPKCTGLRCTFDGSASEDPDGDELTYHWDFGDGSDHGSGVTVAHTFAAPASRTVTLTVTDPSGASDTTSVTAQPSEASPAAQLAHVATAATGGNRVRHAVPVPAAVQAGDRMVLILTANTTSPSFTGPDGWDPVLMRDGRGIALRAWTRVAGDDTGESVAVTSSGYAKSNVTITAYRSTEGTPDIAAAAATIDDAPDAEHTSPAVTAGDHSWVVTYWSDKSNGTTDWATPAQATVRSTATTDGNGRVTSVLADSGAPRPAGPAGGLTATADSTSSRGASLSLVLAP